VVCPASLTLNWQREAERFTPALRPELLSDVTPAILPTLIKEPRLFVTSYGLLRRDIDLLRQIRFGAVVLDEAQHIKNPTANQPRRHSGYRRTQRSRSRAPLSKTVFATSGRSCIS
jgi:SNF2 family DNA or RNA helicase